MGGNHKHQKAHPHRFLKRWKKCWGKFGCFVPETIPTVEAQLTLKSMQQDIEDGSLILDTLGQAVMLPPVMCAPPSSPASVTLFTLFRVTSGRFHSQLGQPRDTFAPFMLENTLVTPPIFSTSTTTPATPLSTAPFTPPPELAHLTTPSSPEVPFAHMLASSFESNCSFSNPNHIRCKYPDTEKGVPPSTTGFDLFYQLYPYGSCMARVASSRSGGSSSGVASPFPERLFLENDDANAGDMVQESWCRNVTFGGFVPKVMTDDTAAVKLEHLERHMKLDLAQNVEGRRSCELLTKIETIDPRKLTYSDQSLATEHPMNHETSFDVSGFVMNNVDAHRSCTIMLQKGGNGSCPTDETTMGMEHIERHRSIDAYGAGLTNTNAEGDRCWESLKDVEDKGNTYCCCSRCSELSRKCLELSEALEQAKEKLTMLEKRVDVLDDKERKLKQLIQWMQLGAKLQQETTVAHVSKEESARFDLQDCSGESGVSRLQDNT